MYKFTKNITCENPEQCSVDIMNKLETKYGFKIHGKNPQGHISMQHTDSNHLIWIFLYDKAGVFESENTITKQIEKKKSDKVKKFSGTLPTESELKKAI